MLYTSTRGKYGPLPAAEAIKLGIAPDSGLFVPTERVMMSMKDIQGMARMSYQQRADKILRPYLTDFTPNQIRRSVDDAYNATSFDHHDVAPLAELDTRLSVLELWHGPTCAFKDMALQMLPHLLVTSMQKTGESAGILILVATSGDTGKAALEGFKDVPTLLSWYFTRIKGSVKCKKCKWLPRRAAM